MDNNKIAKLQQEHKIEKILVKILDLYGCETMDLEKETQKLFNYLTIYLTEARFNIRYCTRKGCSCHPEHGIKKLLENTKLREFLKENHVLKDIEDISNNYIPFKIKWSTYEG